MAAKEFAAQDVLSIRAIKSSKDKIDRLIFHPVQPWVAYSDRTSGVTVWNYDSNEVVYTNQLGGSDDGALQEATLRQRADKVATQAGSPPPPGLTPAQEASLSAKSAASGQVNDLAFFDIDTCFWQIALQRWLQHGAHDASSIPSMARVRGVDGRRWIVTACDNKVTLHDLNSSESLDISRSAAFDSKSPTRLAFLLINAPSLTGGGGGSGGSSQQYVSPVLAVGASSGSIYLVSPTSMTVFAKLTGAHRSAITRLVVLGGDPLGAPDRLLSTSADGTVAIWDPSRTPVRGENREMAPTKTFKAHESGVKDAAFYIAYSPAMDAGLSLKLATVGDDRKVALWDVSTWQQNNKLQPLPKHSCHSIAFAPWGGAGLGVQASLVMTSGDSTSVLGLNPTTAQIHPLIDLQGMIDPGQKKVPKIYHFAVHPTRPHLMAAATNTGVVLLTADASEKPAVVALPAQVMTLEALMHASEAKEAEEQKDQSRQTPEKPPANKGAPGPTYVMATQGKLWSTALRMESRSARDGSSERLVTLEASQREAIADLDQPVIRPMLACSMTGRSISAVWPEARLYTVYSLAPTGVWDVVDRGAGNCIAWASTAPMYAMLSIEHRPEVVVEQKKGFLHELGKTIKKGLTGGGGKEKNAPATTNGMTMTNQASAAQTSTNTANTYGPGSSYPANPGAGAAAGANPVNPENTKTMNVDDQAGTTAPSASTSVVVSPAVTLTSVQVHVVDEERGSQFIAAHDIALNGAQPVLLHGGALLGVVVIDPSTLQRSLRFFSWRDFSAVGPPIPEPRWISWEPECTLVALGYEHTVELCRVHPYFQKFSTLSLPHSSAGLWQSRQLVVSTPSSLHLVFADPVQEFVQEVTLASFQGGAASKTAPSLDATPLPPEQMRPAGPVTIAGVRHSYLWLADAFGRPFLVPLRHPGLRLRSLAARGDLTSARTIAERGLSPAFHDDVARFLAAMSPGDGVKEALLLPGLSPETEMILSIKDGAWDRAALCFQALALGVSDRGLLLLTAGKTANGAGTPSASGTDGLITGIAGMSLRMDHGATVAEILRDHEMDKIQNENGEKEDEKEDSNVGEDEDESASASASESEGDEDEDEDEDEEYVDPIEWDAPLRAATIMRSHALSHDTTTATSNKSNRESFTASATSIVDPGELKRINAAAQLGLRFADAAADSGHLDAARTALGILVRFTDALSPSLLQDLVSRMGRCRMTESTRNLAAAAATARPGSPLLDPGVAALLAALTGGLQSDAVQSTLHASGLAPLSAVYSTVWGQGSKEVAIEKWKMQLGMGADGIDIIPPAVI